MPRYKEYNKVRLTQKAMYQFWGNGYGATPLSVLLEILGVNKFSFYDAFESKENLLVETLTYHYQNSTLPRMQQLRSSGSIIEYLEDTLREEKNGCRGCYILAMTSETGTSVPGAVDLLKTYMSELEEVLHLVAEQALPDATQDRRLQYRKQLLALCTSIPLMYPIKPGRSNLDFAHEVLSVLKLQNPY